MISEVIAVVTLLVTIITYLDELTWAKEHAALLNKWLLAKLATNPTCKYQHNPCRNHRVMGQGRKV